MGRKSQRGSSCDGSGDNLFDGIDDILGHGMRITRDVDVSALKDETPNILGMFADFVLDVDFQGLVARKCGIPKCHGSRGVELGKFVAVNVVFGSMSTAKENGNIA